MTLTNLTEAGNIKSFVAKCYPKEVLTISVVHSGNVKKISYYNYIKEITSQIVSATKKTSIAALQNIGDWYHDRDGQVLYYYSTTASEDILVTFGFFFKTGDTEPLHVDITDTATDLVYYDGRMRETSFIQSIDDISNGTLAISSTTIALINNDGYYQTLARDEVTFKNSAIEVRIFYNAVTNNTIVFTGTIESATFRSKEMILECKDFNKVLQSTAKFTTEENEYVATIDGYPTLPSDKVGTEIPMALGRLTGVSLAKIPVAKEFDTHNSGEPWLTLSVADSWDQKVDDTKMIPILVGSKSIVEVDTAGNTAHTTSVRYRRFLSYRTINSIKTTSKVRLYQATVVDLNPDKTTAQRFGFEVEIPVSNVDDYFVGQQCIWYSAFQFGYSGAGFAESWGAQSGWHRVSYINKANSRIRIAPAFQIFVARLNDSYGESYCFFTPITVSYVDAGKNIYLQGICTSYSENSKISNKLNKIDVARYAQDGGIFGYGYMLADKREWKFGGINCQAKETTTTTNDNVTELENIELSCRFQTERTNLSLGCIIHRTLIEAGYTTDGGTDRILAVGTNSFRDLDTKLGTTYFTLHTGMVDTYLQLLQMMLSSVFGFMYVQADGKVGVRLFENRPYNDTLWTITEDDIIMDSVISDFNSGGIYTRLRATNDTHNDFSSEISYSIRRLLHGDIVIDNQYHFESKEIYEEKVMPRKYEYLSNSVRKFDFTVINNGYDILLGDRISISFTQSNKWLGYPKEYDLFVVGLNKTLQGTTVSAIENIFPAL